MGRDAVQRSAIEGPPERLFGPFDVDGNVLEGDGCRMNCTREICGDRMDQDCEPSGSMAAIAQLAPWRSPLAGRSGMEMASSGNLTRVSDGINAPRCRARLLARIKVSGKATPLGQTMDLSLVLAGSTVPAPRRVSATRVTG